MNTTFESLRPGGSSEWADRFHDHQLKPQRPHREGKPSCGCPACIGLDCFERPRFFAGQLLTEAELGGQMDYVLDKNRLHNRYLHGWGVVCGLGVSCHECDGLVRVHQGYALDPCGNDIVVCRDTDVDIIKLIRECRDDRSRKGDCDPWAAVTEVGCTDREEHWCLQVEYEERDARPIAPLRDSSRGCRCGGSGGGSCGCGCGNGNGNGNGHGHGKSNGGCGTCATGCDCGGKKSSCSCNAAVTASRGVAGLAGLVACEPTRVREGYRFRVCELPEGCTGERSRESLLSGTLFGRVAGCLSMIWGFMGRRVSMEQWGTIGRMVTAPAEDSSDSAYNDSPTNMYESYSALYRGVLDLYRENPFNVRCQMPSAFTQITRDPPGDVSSYKYVTDYAQPQSWHLMTLLLQYAIDCVCQAILPPCAPNPQDDVVGIACVTVRNDKIVRICNLSCRHYAGSFPALGWWTSIVPVLPVIAARLAKLCCSPDLVRAQSPLVNSVLEFIQRKDPDMTFIRAAVTGGGSKALLDALTSLPERLDLSSAARMFAPQLAGTGLSGFVGMSDAGAAAELRAKGHDIRVEDVPEDEVVAKTVAPMRLVAPAGEPVVLRVRDGEVVDAHVESAEVRRSRTVAARSDVSALHAEVARLRADVERLRKRSGAAKKPAREPSAKEPPANKPPAPRKPRKSGGPR